MSLEDYNSQNGLEVTQRHAYVTEKDQSKMTAYVFQFADLESREADSQDQKSDLKALYGSLGTIKLELFRCRNPRKVAPRNQGHSLIEGIGAVPEKALKGEAVSHSVKYEYCPSPWELLT